MRLLGLDLGGTKLLARGLCTASDATLRALRPTGRAFGPDAMIAAASELAGEARDALGGLDAIGIGFPGLVDHQRGIARTTPMLDGWRDVALAARVTAATGVPCIVDNDVNAAAAYEHRLREARDFLYVAVGTGIGGAIVAGGELWRGAAGFAGEIGHLAIDRAGPECVCGRRGCVHLYASGAAIERALELPPGGLAGALAADHPIARRAVHDAAVALGVAIGSALNLLDVPLVVLGGGLAELGSPWLAAVAVSAHRECFPEIAERCAIEPSRGGYDAGALGAAWLASSPLRL